MSKKTLILGASNNPLRYAHKAAGSLLNNGHEIVPIGNRKADTHGHPIQKAGEPITDIDTITLYLNPRRQKEYYDYIVNTKPKRVIFNPGTENRQLQSILDENGIAYEEACTLVMLAHRQY